MIKEKPFRVYIQSNSPGELTAWVSPLLEALALSQEDIEVIVLLTPCQYASGREYDIASAYPLVTRVLRPKETLRFIFSWPFLRREKGLVVFLGGDPLYTQLISLKLGIPALGYSERHADLGFRFKRTFMRGSEFDLMYDHVQIQKQAIDNSSSKQEIDLLFFPGSRPQHFNLLFPFYIDVAKKLLEEDPTLKIAFQISPFISSEVLNGFSSDLEGLSGVQMRCSDSVESLMFTRLLVSIPGTNTAEAMYLETPMLVLMPLNHPERIILDGAAGLIDKIPFVGLWIKKKILAWLAQKKPMLSHPNRRAKTKIVPEIIAVLERDDIVKTIRQLLRDSDSLVRIKKALASLNPSQNCAEAMKNEIVALKALQKGDL